MKRPAVVRRNGWSGKAMVNTDTSGVAVDRRPQTRDHLHATPHACRHDAVAWVVVADVRRQLQSLELAAKPGECPDYCPS